MQLNGTFRTIAPLRCHPEAGVDGWWVEWFWMSRQMLTVSDDHYQSGLLLPNVIGCMKCQTWPKEKSS